MFFSFLQTRHPSGTVTERQSHRKLQGRNKRTVFRGCLGQFFFCFVFLSGGLSRSQSSVIAPDSFRRQRSWYTTIPTTLSPPLLIKPKQEEYPNSRSTTRLTTSFPKHLNGKCAFKNSQIPSKSNQKIITGLYTLLSPSQYTPLTHV